jgi:hypothetical protein
MVAANLPLARKKEATLILVSFLFKTNLLGGRPKEHFLSKYLNFPDKMLEIFSISAFFLKVSRF